MKKISSILPRWFPAISMMLVIFLFSSRSSSELPNFLGWDYAIKKTSHALGYGLLALSYLYGFRFDQKYRVAAWLFAVLFSASDEFHQSFVAGRHASIVDVAVFDNLGALTALFLHSIYWRRYEQKNDQTGIS